MHSVKIKRFHLGYRIVRNQRRVDLLGKGFETKTLLGCFGSILFGCMEIGTAQKRVVEIVTPFNLKRVLIVKLMN